MDILEIYRIEKKYLISYTTASLHCFRLKSLLEEDAHNGPRGYTVRSLYFDTINNDDFYDKEDGLQNRRKVRLRVYPPDFNMIKLELKEKRGADQLKRSLTISKTDANSLISGNYTNLLDYGNALAMEFYRIMTFERYMPRCVIEYNRFAFLLSVNDVRITFDSDIRASECGFDCFFDSSMALCPVMHEDDMILEVKYKHFLFSYIKEMLHFNGKIETSASKYYLSRSIGCA